MPYVNLFNVFLSVVLVLIASCATPPSPLSNPEPIDFKTGIQQLTHQLLKQAQTHTNVTERSEKMVVIDPFVTANNGKIATTVSQQIESLMLEEIQRNFTHWQVSPLSEKTRSYANYMITGVVDNQAGYQKITASLVQVDSDKKIAESNIWVVASDLNAKLSSTVSPDYQDSPVYLEDKRIEQMVNTTVVDLPNQEYYGSLSTEALLDEADATYALEDFAKSLLLYRLAAQRDDGQTVRTYAGLYQTNLQLDEQTEAEKAFLQFLANSVKEDKKLNLKFFFHKDSVDFIKDEELRSEYAFWLRQIGDYFNSNNQCFHIIGYSSPSGNPEYNHQLSLLRAQKIQELLQAHIPEVMQRSKVVGEGETQSGMETLARRVEIMVADCL